MIEVIGTLSAVDEVMTSIAASPTPSPDASVARFVAKSAGSAGAVHRGMQIEITFRGMTPSVSAEMSARRWIERLTRVYANIIGCRVVVEIPHQHHERGNLFHVRIELVVPGQVLAVTQDPGIAEGHEDVYVAISDAFRAVRRQLQSYAAVRRREMKRHERHAS
jgi:ribosome-associated translation inhibitor RaiA